jgi:hypothetical protein
MTPHGDLLRAFEYFLGGGRRGTSKETTIASAHEYTNNVPQISGDLSDTIPDVCERIGSSGSEARSRFWSALPKGGLEPVETEFEPVPIGR